MTENALDDALAYLVEAFGHVSEAELQAFLDGTPRAGADLAATAGDPSLLAWPAAASVASREAFGVVQAAPA